jgi:uncharacterized membrane protein (UPF0127 family)
MLDNKSRREILEAAKATDYQGSIMDLYDAARQGQDVMQMLQPMQVAQTPEQKQVGLREQHAMGNTQASMAFPDTPPNTPFNTKGMKAPINISKFDEQGHLVQSFKNVPPGIESLPTGPGKGTVIETPAYKKGGYRAKYQTGSFKDGMNGMMKARIALENEFGNNPAIQRMIVPPDNSYKFDNGDTGTHYMGSYGNYAIPEIQDVNGKLEMTGPRMNEAIRFNRPEDAMYFAKNYKDVAPAFNKSVYPNKYQFGGRQGDTFQEVDTYIKPGQNIRPNWAQTPDAVTNYTFGKNLVDDESRFSLGLQGTDILDEIKYRADLIGSAGIGVGNRKGKSFRPAGENLRAGIRGQASWQGVPGNVLENMFPRSGVNVRGSFEGEAGLAYANGAVSPYMSVTPQTNFSLNDNLSLGIGYEMRGRYDKNRNNPIYGSTGTGTVAPLSQRDAYSGMGRGAGRLSLKYNMGDGDFVEGYYSKPNSLYQGSMYPAPGVVALENEGPRLGVRLKKSF